MTSKTLLRAAGAIAITAVLAGGGAATAVAQDYPGSTVTVGGGTIGVDFDDAFDLPPGLTIDGGDVVNETGIGVTITGGDSVGASPGGGPNASVVE